jgi:regulator of sirC expression with transglutaminase-like and TPR domain
MNLNEIVSLINLLDDPDENIFQHVQDKLIQIGIDAIPYLESSWEENKYSGLFQERIETLIDTIQFNQIKEDLNDWNNSENNILDGWILLTKWQFPGINESTIKGKIEEIKNDIWIEIKGKQTAQEKILTFNKVFYTNYKFQGNTKNYHSPINSFIHTVLETKHGNPLSLAILYSTIAQMLHIPIYGVNLPNHFILAYVESDLRSNDFKNLNRKDILFYINAFSNGSILNEKDIHSFLKQLKIEPNESFYIPCSYKTILLRIITNLISSYQQLGNIKKVEQLILLKEILLH